MATGRVRAVGRVSAIARRGDLVAYLLGVTLEPGRGEVVVVKVDRRQRAAS
jgi:hypothetical protein